MRERWRQGESLHAIARLFDRHHATGWGISSRTCSIRPPPRRRFHLACAPGRTRRDLTWRDRRPVGAHDHSLIGTSALHRESGDPPQRRSLRQVTGWLRRTCPQDGTRQVSHETVGRTLLIQARVAFKQELLQHLRYGSVGR